VSLLEREGWSQIDAVVHDGEQQFIFAGVVPGAAQQPVAADREG
jgi:hypothetical protein